MAGASLEGRVIRGVNLSATSFINDWSALPAEAQVEAKETIKSLLLADLDQLPRKLHCHQLVKKNAPSALNSNQKVAVWTLHITADDRYKASFTLEKGTAYFRRCGKHDTMDKTP